MITQRIPSIDPATATGTKKKFFDMLQSALGVIPNMTRSMAQSPAVLEGYIPLSGALSKGSLGKKLGEELALTDPDSVARYIRIQIAGRLDSTGDSWNEPHFEKLLSIQAQAIRMYSQSYGQWHAPECLAAAQNVHRYVRDFLTSPEGAFYVGQDADVTEGDDRLAYFALDAARRRALGTAKVDEHLYARENGWMINALCVLYAVSDDATALQEAKQSARWVITHRSLEEGGFSHSDQDPAGPYLGDTLAMGQAFLALYEVTGEREWLADLERLPSRTQITELNCEEGWCYIAAWTGVQLSLILYLVGASPKAKWVMFYPFDDFWGSIDMPEALHPQTLLVYGMNGEDLTPDHGAPVRLRIPRQVGYKNLKYIARISVTDSLKDVGDGNGSAAPESATLGTVASDAAGIKSSPRSRCLFGVDGSHG